VAERVSADSSAWRERRTVEPTRWVAVGDPQAPLERYFEVLRARELLGADGWLRPEVGLVSMGDHFDFGSFEERRAAADSAYRLLSWLAAHPPEQVTLLLGNHDMARVGELIAFDDAQFESASASARVLYLDSDLTRSREREFLERYPALPSIELAARDLATFRVEQRELVTRLLTTGRFRLATATPDAVLCHAGVTTQHLTAIGLSEAQHSQPLEVASALNAALHSAVHQWQSTPDRPLDVEGLHRVGCAERGEGGGALLHRAAHPHTFEASGGEEADLYDRRFDPRRLPPGLVQVIGHVQDAKCRTLLRDWVVDRPGPLGSLRNLTVRGCEVAYRTGAPGALPSDAAALVFTDGAMNKTPPMHYEVLDLKRLRAA
jgi:hypothetical protein